MAETKAAEKPKYKLDWQDAEITLRVVNYTLIHRLRRPTYEELLAREGKTAHEQIRISAEEIEPRNNQDEASAWLWDQICTDVAGYGMGAAASGFQEVTDELRKRIPLDHKARAIEGLYQVYVELDKDNASGAFFDLLGETTYPILVRVGSYTSPVYELTFHLRQPTEGQWQAFDRQCTTTRAVGGDRKARVVTKTNLGAAVRFFDDLFVRVEGGTVAGQEWAAERSAEFRQAIDPVWKQFIALAFHRGLEARLRD